MGQGYYREVIALLEAEAGAIFVRSAKGSHERWQTADGKPLTIPRNLDNKNTANGILKQAGVAKRF